MENVDLERPRSFKLPPALVTEDNTAPVDKRRNSPSCHSPSSAAGNSPRNATPSSSPSPSLLAPYGSQGLGSSSPRTVPLNKLEFGAPKEGGKFEDPLLSMPSVRRNSAAEASCAHPHQPQSPSFRTGLSNSNSFSARRSPLEFRRSLPGGAMMMGSSPSETGTRRASMSHESRGSSDFGHMEPLAMSAARGASPKGASDCGVRGPDEEEATDADVDLALQLVGRAHSFTPAVLRDGTWSATSTPGCTSRAPRSSVRAVEEEDTPHRRALWRERSLSRGPGAVGAGGGSAGEGLQNKTHAALEQLRGELKSLSVRSMQGAFASAGGSTSGSGAASGNVVLGGSNTGPAGGGWSSNGGHAYPPTSPGPSPGAAGAAGPAGGATAATQGGGTPPRHSEGYAPVSPSRLSVTYHRSSGGGASELHAPPQTAS